MTASLRLAIFATCAALAFATSAAPAAFAAPDQKAKSAKSAAAGMPVGRIGIATVVNDDVITFSDIEDRMRLYMLGAPPNLPEEAKQRVLQQALYRLVDERLQMQEAKALNIVVNPKDVEMGFATIAAQNKMEPPQFREQLMRAGVNLTTIEEQIAAEIAWNQVVRRKLRPQITISESEIDTEVDRLQRGSGRTEYRLAEIFLSFDGPATEKNARELGEKLVAEIRKGRPFSQAAREFSEAPGAATGGDIGWIEEGVLDSALGSVVATLQPGQLSDPIRTDKGYHLLFLRETRQKGLPAPAGAMTAPAAPDTRPGLIASDMPAPDARNVDAPKVITGEAAAAPAPAALPADEMQREEVASRLGLQRLEQMAERYLRDLRATAFIEQRF
ncbi:MAG: peptidylprolyl isomerase [Alphaproteobacteria bacterium]